MYFVGMLYDSDGLGTVYMARMVDPGANGISNYVTAWQQARRYRSAYPGQIFAVGGEFDAPEDPKRLDPVPVE